MKLSNKPSTGLSGAKATSKRAENSIVAAKEVMNQTIDEVFDGNLLLTQLF